MSILTNNNKIFILNGNPISYEPIKLYTNLNSSVINTSVDTPTLILKARDINKNFLNANHIVVKVDDQIVTTFAGTASLGFIYNLPSLSSFFLGGDEGQLPLTITVNDDYGNSITKSYIINIVMRDLGEVIGTVTVQLDLTNLGLGVIDVLDTQEYFQGNSVAHCITSTLEYLGYNVSNSGTIDTDFMLIEISRAGGFEGTAIPTKLKNLLTEDNIAITLPKPAQRHDHLKNGDYTSRSYWTYAVNEKYPACGMSSYYPMENDIITLRFTLNEGKDIGAAVENYSTIWVNGKEVTS